jgi:hypothetical protein
MFKRAITAAILATTMPTAASFAASAYAVGSAGPRSWGAGGLDYPNFSEAQRQALHLCARGGPGCGIVALFSDACFALAVQVGAPGYTASVRPTLAGARQAAMLQCLSHRRPCSIKASYCDFSRPLPIEDSAEFAAPSAGIHAPAARPELLPPCGGYPDFCEYK